VGRNFQNQRRPDRQHTPDRPRRQSPGRCHHSHRLVSRVLRGWARWWPVVR